MSTKLSYHDSNVNNKVATTNTNSVIYFLISKLIELEKVGKLDAKHYGKVISWAVQAKRTLAQCRDGLCEMVESFYPADSDLISFKAFGINFRKNIVGSSWFRGYFNAGRTIFPQSDSERTLGECDIADLFDHLLIVFIHLGILTRGTHLLTFCLHFTAFWFLLAR